MKVLGLLDGLVDPETGDVLQDEQVQGLLQETLPLRVRAHAPRQCLKQPGFLSC